MKLLNDVLLEVNVRKAILIEKFKDNAKNVLADESGAGFIEYLGIAVCGLGLVFVAFKLFNGMIADQVMPNIGDFFTNMFDLS